MSLRGGWMDIGIVNVFERWLGGYRDSQCL